MSDSPRRWLTVPQVRNPIQQRQALLLQTLLLAILVLAGLDIILNVLIVGPAVLTVAGLLPNLVVVIGTAAALVVLRRGAFVWSVRIVTAVLLLVFAETLLTTPYSIANSILIMFVIPITLAGLLLGRRELILSSLISVLVVGIAVGLERFRVESETLRLLASVSFVVFVLAVGLFALFLDQFGGVLRTALQDAVEREQEAHTQRTRFEVTLRSIGDAVIATDTRGRITFMNPVAERLTGWSFADARERHLDEVFVIVNESTRLAVESPVSRVLNEGQIVGLANHTVVIGKDGREHPIDDSGAPILDMQNQITGVVLVFHDITARRHAEVLLDRYQLLSEYARDILLFVRTDGRIIEANQAATVAYGYSYDELVSMRLHDLRDPKTLPLLASQIDAANDEGLLFETTHRRKDGTLFPVEVSARGVFIGNERLLISVIRDITQRRQSDIERGWLAAIVAASDDAIIGLDAERRFTSWNPGAERMFGYTADEMLGRSSGMLSPPDLQNEAPAVLDAVMRDQRVLRYETERLRKDGSRIGVAVSISPILGADGTVEGSSAIVRDISERKRGEDQQRFLVEASTILAGSLDLNATLHGLAHLVVPFLADWCAVDMLDAEGTIERVAVAHIDPAKVELAHEVQRRYPLEQGGQNSTSQILASGTSMMVPEITEEMMVAVSQDAEHLQIIRELGLQSWMSVPLAVQGQPVGTLTFVTSDSGRRYDEADLHFAEDLARRAGLAVENARLYRESQEAIRTRDTFLSIASHELKTPLTGLMGYLQLLQRRVEREQSLSSRDQRALRAIGDQANRLHLLVEDMLNISRIEIGLFTVERRPIDLAALVRSVVDEIHITLNHHSIVLQAPDDPVMIDGDERRLEQVLQNLLSNAIKYTPHGGEIGVRLTADDPFARIEVRDPGLGIPKIEQEHLFERFYRARNIDAAQISGFGLGLYLVKEIVSRHDGTVEVTSSEGQGSTFTVVLPLTSKTLEH